jgi:hypothetical protein
MLEGLIFDCPFGNEEYDCPFSDIHKKSSKEWIESLRKMDIAETKILMRIHAKCLNRRES